MYNCVMYQDYALGTDRVKARAIKFPKYLIIEQISLQGSKNQQTFFRIHEKAKLDTNSDDLSVLYLTGCHVDRQGN